MNQTKKQADIKNNDKSSNNKNEEEKNVTMLRLKSQPLLWRP